jgi:hypothetical protein
MATMQVTFTNNNSESHACLISDVGIDPNVPKQLFSGYLDAGASTDQLTLYSDGTYGHAAYQLSGHAIQDVPDITDGTNVAME